MEKKVKNNKMLIIGIIFIVLVLVVGIVFLILGDSNKESGSALKDAPSTEKKDDDLTYDIDGYSVKVGYLNSQIGGKVVIDDYSAFKNYFSKYDNMKSIIVRYNEEFFVNNSLAIQYVSVNSGSISITNVKGKVVDDKVLITYEENRPEVGIMDMSGYFLIVEVSKKIKEVA